MQEIIGFDEQEKHEGYEVIITGITWDKDTVSKFHSKKDFSSKLPDQMTLIIPEKLAEKENTPTFNDEVETFVYNLLAKRFNHIAHHCQIWLPCEEQSL